MTLTIDDVLDAAAPVMPVVVIDEARHALPLADALAAGGMRVIEITLRTTAALDAIEAIRSGRPDMLVGAGTVLSPLQLQAVAEAGAQFAVSPGLTPTLLAAARQPSFPFLPGAITPAEVQLGLEAGYNALKFFPAEAAGGTRMLASFASVYPELAFCPTGGINADNVGDYLSLPNVSCVGGSWVAPRKLVIDQDWNEITRLARAALE